MIDIGLLRKVNPGILAIGSHPPIIQSMLDFDYLIGKKKPSVKAIVVSGRKFERYFFGKQQILIPVFDSFQNVPSEISQEITFFFNTTSARRAKDTTIEALASFPTLLGGTIFAEDVPERHSLEVSLYAKEQKKCIIGPSSVGLVIPGSVKLGAIGGVDYRQLISSKIMTEGNVAVFSASGGMVGEIINIVSSAGKSLSFSLSFGGDRFPITTPYDAFLMAQNDPQTEMIVYYGELGGLDEYAIAELLNTKKVTKPVICYIAGVVSELFVDPPQFGHAKAIAKSKEETSHQKRQVLENAGAVVGKTFIDFVERIQKSKQGLFRKTVTYTTMVDEMNQRKDALITTTISSDVGGNATILGEDLLSFATNRSFAYIVASLFLSKRDVSTELETFFDFVLRLLVDHGPYVSGAINTIITARAGRDLVSSLAAGLLTIGPRFGGAINQAAVNWITGVRESNSPYDFVEGFAKKKQYISGIGHRKYRVDFPDPRVSQLLVFVDKLKKKRFTTFAMEVQKITSVKKGNLILNVDGAIGAVLLDILSEKENFSDQKLQHLTEIEFFNALFVLSRSVGFISHFLDQKRLDEGLFRLPDDLVLYIPEKK